MMPRKALKFLFKAIIVGAILLTGWLIAKFYYNPNVTFDTQVNVLDLITLCVTVIIAWYISSILETEKEDRRTQKDLIIKRIDDIYDLIDSSSTNVLANTAQLHEVTSHLKRIHVSIKTIKKLLDKAKMQCEQRAFDAINTDVRQLRLLTTNTAINSNSAPPMVLDVSVVNGIVNLSSSRKTAVEIAYDKLKDDILLLQLEVNRC